MTMTPLPTTFDALTPEWLTRALNAGHQAGEVKVRAVTCEPFKNGQGTLSLLARLTLDYDGPAPGAPRTLIAKLPSDNEFTKGGATMFRFYEREARFYRDVAQNVPLRTARRFFSEFDPSTGDFVLLLEDLAQAREGDQLVGATREEAEQIIREIAKQHLAYWGKSRLQSVEWVPASDDQANKDGVALYPDTWPMFLERFGPSVPEEMRPIGEALGGKLGAILDRLATAPNTLLHGDLRLDNVFFPAAGAGQAPVALIDWQFLVRGAGAYDIAYFLGQSLKVEVRRAHDKELLRLYHGLLTEGGVKDYSFEQLVEDFRWSVLYGFAVPVMAGVMADVANERAQALMRAMTERSAAMVMDWKAGELLA
jgi:hypothetical protein